MKKKILISSGGSGGHVIPAITFYDHLKENHEVFLTLDKRGSKFINEKKYDFEIISSPRLSFDIIHIIPGKFWHFYTSRTNATCIFTILKQKISTFSPITIW